jgi:hypothetical protein
MVMNATVTVDWATTPCKQLLAITAVAETVVTTVLVIGLAVVLAKRAVAAAASATMTLVEDGSSPYAMVVAAEVAVVLEMTMMAAEKLNRVTGFAAIEVTEIVPTVIPVVVAAGPAEGTQLALTIRKVVEVAMAGPAEGAHLAPIIRRAVEVAMAGPAEGTRLALTTRGAVEVAMA